MQPDFYFLMKSKQQWGTQDALQIHLSSAKTVEPLLQNALLPTTEVPFLDSLKNIEEAQHTQIYGTRVIEEPIYTQALEAQVYIPATAQTHMTRLAEKATQDYLRHLESRINLHSFQQFSILDVGGGTGHLLLSIAHVLARRYPSISFSYFLLEPSLSMGEEARKNFSPHPYPFHIFFRLIEDPKNREIQVDWVMSHTMLHHLEDPLEASLQMRQMAKHLLTIRDLSRPPRAFFQEIWQEQGRFYEGKMKELFGNSLLSSLSYPEFLMLAKHLKAEVEVLSPMYQVLIVAPNKKTEKF